MSDDVKVNAEAAEGRATAHDATGEMIIRGPGTAHRNLPGGPPSKQGARIRAIEAAAEELGEAATRRRVAQRLGKVDTTYGEEEAGQFKADVRAAGGWEAIIARVRARREK
ncbi:MAG: hypothetical protein M3P14_01760 [Chloroflexota bacterium]|nr:hypothetical protein [Chloroflexota bacterium]